MGTKAGGNLGALNPWGSRRTTLGSFQGSLREKGGGHTPGEQDAGAEGVVLLVGRPEALGGHHAPVWPQPGLPPMAPGGLG